MAPRVTGVLLAGLAVVLPASAQETAPPMAAPGNQPATVRCESNKGRPRTCPADTRGGVRLVRQLSRSPCIEGENWGVRDGEIWVKAGCRADFGLAEIGAVTPGPAFFTCESKSAARTHCPVSTREGVALVRQLSKSACIQHSTWGYDRNGVWVSQGCRAEFRAGDEEKVAAAADPGPQSVRCESDRGRERRCEVGVWKGAQLTKQLSKTPCVEGHNWGWDQRGVWVSRGCRAEFVVW